MTTAVTAGRLRAILGPVVHVDLERAVMLGELVRIGDQSLLGEVVALEGDSAIVQVYEETAGLAPGTPVRATGHTLEIELGPGLMGTVFDGIQRPLARLADTHGDFLGAGQEAVALDRDRLWTFAPVVRVDAALAGGGVLGTVEETATITHRILVPPHLSGRITSVAAEGPCRVEDIIATIVDHEGVAHPLRLFHTWSVRRTRPFRARLGPSVPLLTGQRVLDTFFPLPRGGACGMPGGFGTGKTVMQQQLCRWAQADVIVYVGCGERGNEMTELLTKLPDLIDPRTGRPLSERTVLIANTSNMPVPAREASIYTGVTVAEYYRDMGYHVALLADSTSRWAEALREVSGRLGEMPAEEGYPPYLSSRLAAYYERAGRVETLAGPEGSVTLISAISPSGGDVTEPVTRHTQRFTQCFWTLDKERAQARVFPAISLRDSYSHLTDDLAAWWTEHVAPDWPSLRQQALGLLDEAERVDATARLIGAEALPPGQQWLLMTARLFEDGFLRQNAFDPRDASCSPERQGRLLRLLVATHTRGAAAIAAGVSPHALRDSPAYAAVGRANSDIGDEALAQFDTLAAARDAAFAALELAAHADPAGAGGMA